MKSLKLFVVAFVLLFNTSPSVADDHRLSSQLVGLWMEYSPSSNLVSFSKDGKVKLFLKKGEIGDLKALHGTWTVPGR